MTLARLLRSDDLEELAGLAADYEPSAADEQAVGAVLAEWSDVQAVANLLMYPRLIPADKRVAALVRGLCDDEGYLRLAAAVGVGQLPPEDLDDDDRDAVLPELFALVAHDAQVTAKRAALTAGPLLRRSDAAEALGLLGHPVRAVRRNLERALLDLLGSPGLRALLDGGELPDQVAETARAALSEDGIDLSVPADEQRWLSTLAWVPSLAEWTS